MLDLADFDAKMYNEAYLLFAVCTKLRTPDLHLLFLWYSHLGHRYYTGPVAQEGNLGMFGNTFTFPFKSIQ